MALRLLIVFMAVVLIGTIGLAIYGATVRPPQQVHEQVLPNEQFGN
jgi:hypothetical protein